MAKQPETVDRFEIAVSVTKDQLGHVMAALITAGVPPEMMQSRMVTDVLNFKNRQQHDISGADFARAFVAEHPTFTRAEVIKHFRDAGRTDSAATGALWAMRQNDVIRKLDGGNFQRADIKAIAGPKGNGKANGKTKVKVHAPNGLNKKGEPRKRVANSTDRYDVSNRDFLTKRIAGRTKITVRELEEVFTSNGRNAKSVSALLSNFVKERKVKHVDAGTYSWVGTKVKKVRLTPRVPPTAKANGSAGEAHTAETVTNGQ